MNYVIDHERGIALVHLAPKNGKRFVTIVDIADLEAISGWHWRPIFPEGPDGQTYAIACRAIAPGKRQYVYMHRVILGITDRSTHVDHINHDGLDNRRENIRSGTHQQNHFNRRGNRDSSSRFKGVFFCSSQRKWTAAIKKDGQRTYLGRFANEEDAARAYDEAAREMFGEHAYLNFQ